MIAGSKKCATSKLTGEKICTLKIFLIFHSWGYHRQNVDALPKVVRFASLCIVLIREGRGYVGNLGETKWIFIKKH